MPLRKTAQGVAAPTDVYVNQNGHTITLIGVMHIAEQTFWNQLVHKLLKTQDTIHLEGVKPYPGDLQQLTTETIQKMDALTKIASFSKELAQETGLIFQKDGIRSQLPHDITETGWENVDLDLHTAVQHVSYTDLMKTAESIDTLTHELNKKDKELSIGKFMLFMLRHPGIMKTFSALSKLFQKDEGMNALQGFILDDRNEYAIQKALTVTNNVTLVWGAAHLQGMGKLLRKAGYKHHKRTWDLLISKNFTTK